MMLPGTLELRHLKFFINFAPVLLILLQTNLALLLKILEQWYSFSCIYDPCQTWVLA